MLAFDRFLDPRTVTRQSINLEDSGGSLLTDALVAYDPVLLTVTLSNPGAPSKWLTAGEQYRVVLKGPADGGTGGGGIMAIDGATLAAPVTILFTAGAAAVPSALGEPVMHFCADVFPIFKQKCAVCHIYPCQQAVCPTPAAYPGDGGIETPYEGLVLQAGPNGNLQGIQATAIGQVANESNTGPLAAPGTSSTGQPFGVDMPIIDPGQPGNSWLLYKTMLPSPYDAGVPAAVDPANDPDASSSNFDEGLVSPITRAERGRLSNYVLGNLMPYPRQVDPAASDGVLDQRRPLTLPELERLRAWIGQGAVFDQPACK